MSFRSPARAHSAPPTARARSARASLAILALAAMLFPSILSCGAPEQKLAPRSLTWAELRTVRRAVLVTPPDEAERDPYPRERLVDGEVVKVKPEGLAWLRRDGGATLLVRGPAELTVRAAVIELREGRVFIDTPSGATTEIETPAGPLHLAQVRASVDVGAAGTEVYVLAGEVRGSKGARAGAGERLVVKGKGAEAKASTEPALTWEDWTGGLATTDRAAEPSPYGVGTVGARRPGDTGSPRFALSIQRLDVRVSISQDFAITEVDELFFNPSSEVVEGVYRFRTPDGATLHRFGVDRDGVIKWGRVKEKAAAAAQYQSNVYQGSTEDPALLEWDAPGVYRAKLYPIGPGETRRVVVTYAEWLGRTGKKGERRLYVYPMAAEGAEESLPHIEELYASIDLSKAGAKEIRAGMAGARDGDALIVREHDLVPRADLAVELYDDGLPQGARGFSAPHTVDVETLPPGERAEALRGAKNEAEYLLVPVHSGGAIGEVPLPKGGLDLAVVIDTSAATDDASLAIARAATAAILAHVGKDDRVAVWAGDSSLRSVVTGREGLAAVDEAGRRAILAGLATLERGGATDLGAMLSEAAAKLDPARRGALVYIGDGSPTVGELGLVDLRDRLSKLPRPVRIFGLGVGDRADMAILKGLARGAFAERIGDANAAARSALRLLEIAERPAWLGATIDLGPTVERVYPRDLGALVADESVVVVGRLTGAKPTSLTLNGPAGATKITLGVTAIEDRGDLRRRWAEGRLAEMIDQGIGRAAMVDLGSRHGIITPVTSLYVPTKNEMTSEERTELERARVSLRAHEAQKKQQNQRRMPSKYDARKPSAMTGEGDDKDSDGVPDVAENNNKEGGTGTRAKGEEGSMGRPMPKGRGRFGSLAKEKADTATAVAAAEAPPPPPVQAAPTAGYFPNSPAPSAMASAVFEPPAEVATPQKKAPARGPVGAPGAPSFGLVGGGQPPADKPADIPNVPATRIANGAPKATDNGIDETVALPRGDIAGDPLGNTWGGEIGDAFGAGGLGLSGIGEGGGGRGEGIGLGSIGGLAGTNAPADDRKAEVQSRLAGRHVAKQAELDGKDVDKNAEKAKQKPEEGRAFAQSYRFAAGASVQLGDVGHFALRCGSAAFLPFEERVILWRERLGRATGNAWAAQAVYRRALSACEAPTWRERSKLLSLMLDAMPAVSSKVALWRLMFSDRSAADTLYRGILARVRTPDEMRQLHDALGLRSIDPGVLAKLLKDAGTPALRVKVLRGLVVQWPDDFALAVKLLDALEDAGDDPSARELGRKLRARPDADARLRTAVGELYLRLGKRAAQPAQKALDEAEARRAFGEIVEFAPDDPIARRRLGDLLRAHGWFAEAARQYETLARLSPDDPSVALLLAAAAEGLGKLEEAVKWTEKGGAAGAPDVSQGPATTARAFAATYLAWGKLSAIQGGRADEAKALSARLARVLSSERSSKEALRGARVSLVWSHPELHPALWTNALGAGMPAQEGDVTLGIAAAIVPTRDNAWIEIRIEQDELEHAARLGAEAVLTVVLDEGGEGEKIVRLPVSFAKDGPATKRFSIASGEVKEVRP